MNRQHTDFAIAHYECQVKIGWMRCLGWATPTHLLFLLGDRSTPNTLKSH
ncbi:hypothetical protein [Nostoc sp. CCY0012]